MIFYTSYFGAISKLPEGFELVSIAAWTPEWFKGRSIEMVAPPKGLVKKYKEGKISKEKYETLYRRKLASVNYKVFASIVARMFSGSKGVIFLCYEKSDDFCHRHFFADWVNFNGGHIEEYKVT